MQLKGADDKQPDIAALAALSKRQGVDAHTGRRIDQEVRQIRAGVKGEQGAAYEIEFHLGSNPDRITIHDLRLEVGGRVAQIDHLIINRLLDIWVLETKHFAEGVSINDHGEWTGFSGGRPYGMASPVEQNRKHIAVLDQVFTGGIVPLPKRFGIATIKPSLRGRVLVSNGARITRPRSKAAQKAIDGLDTVIKVDQLMATIDRDTSAHSTAAIAKIVSAETIERLGQALVALHQPVVRNWAARFGMAADAVPMPLTSPPATPSGPSSPAGRCASCGRSISKGIVDFCAAYPNRFYGQALCISCQRRPSETRQHADGDSWLTSGLAPDD